MIPALLPGSADDLVAFGAPGAKTIAETFHDAARIAAALPEDGPRRVLTVFESDRHAFASSLLAIFARGHVAVIPPDTRRSTLLALRATCDAVLHDTHSGLRHRVAALLEADVGDADDTARASREAWREGRARVELGGLALDSSALGEELARLQAALPWDGGRVACTAPVGHRFGLVWGVLRPMVHGGAFARSMSLGALDSDTLITVPHHLALLAPTDDVRRVVSSMGSLSAELAARFDDVTDVYTTSAAGAVAFRRADERRFVVLPTMRVSVSDAGTLAIDGARTATADLVEGDDTGFEIIGNTDERVAIDGRVFDLSKIAATVRSFEGVDDAGAVRGADDASILVAVASATASRDTIRDELVDRVGGAFADVVVTRALPRDALGRLLRSDVFVLFGLGPDGVPRAFDLEWGAATSDERGHHFELKVPDNYRWFDGHFDQYPVLPAAVQLNRIVLPCVAQSGLVSASLLRAERLKFSGRIGPGDTLRVTLVASKPNELRFEIVAGDRSCSSGRLRFGEAES